MGRTKSSKIKVLENEALTIFNLFCLYVVIVFVAVISLGNSNVTIALHT